MHDVRVHVQGGTVEHRSAPARKARDGQVEAAPEEVDRAALAEEAAAEHFEDAVGADEDPPEGGGGRGVVAGVDGVVCSNGIGSGTSTALVQMWTSMPRLARVAMTSA